MPRKFTELVDEVMDFIKDKLDYSKPMWTGEDLHGNNYCVFVDHSSEDFSVKVIIKKDRFGEYYVLSCDILPRSKETKENAS
jgi:hypothetical protein